MPRDHRLPILLTLPLMLTAACSDDAAVPRLSPTPSASSTSPSALTAAPTTAAPTAVPTGPPTGTAPAAPAAVTAAQLVARLSASPVGCADPQPAAKQITSDGLRCTSATGRQVIVLAGLDAASRQDYLDLVSGGGFGEDQYLVLDPQWIVNASGEGGALAAQVAGVLGGQVQRYPA